MMSEIQIGSRVKELREQSGLNQSQIAVFLGVDQSYVSKCEKNERQYNVDMLEKLSSLFGCTLTNLIDNNTSIETLNIAFRSNNIGSDDLVAISEINKIALNIHQMVNLLEMS